MTPAAIAELRRLLESATPGPWIAEPAGVCNGACPDHDKIKAAFVFVEAKSEDAK